MSTLDRREIREHSFFVAVVLLALPASKYLSREGVYNMSDKTILHITGTLFDSQLEARVLGTLYKTVALLAQSVEITSQLLEHQKLSWVMKHSTDCGVPTLLGEVSLLEEGDLNPVSTVENICIVGNVANRVKVAWQPDDKMPLEIASDIVQKLRGE